MYRIQLIAQGSRFLVGTSGYSNVCVSEKLDDGTTYDREKRVAQLQVLAFEDTDKEKARLAALRFPHLMHTDAGDNLVDAKHIDEFIEYVDKLNQELSRKHFELVSKHPRAERVEKKAQENADYMRQHHADEATALAVAAATRAKYPSDEFLQISNLELRVFRVEGGEAEEMDIEESADLQAALEDSKLAQAAEARAALLSHYVSPVLESLISIARQSANAPTVSGSTMTGWRNHVQALEEANTASFGTPLPELSTFLKYFAPRISGQSTEYVHAGIRGFIHFFYEQGISNYLPVKALNDVGYFDAFISEIGTNPQGRRSFADQYYDMADDD